MIERRLRRLLETVARRYRRLALWRGLTLTWLVAALAAWLATGGPLPDGQALPLTRAGLLMVVLIGLLVSWIVARNQARDDVWLARQIEREYPQLDSRLITAAELTRSRPSESRGFLERQVVDEVVHLGHRQSWEETVSSPRLLIAQVLQWGALALCLLSVARWQDDAPKLAARQAVKASAESGVMTVEPGDTEVERGSSVLVLARFPEKLPREVLLQYTDEKGNERRLSLSKSLDDPVFAGRLDRVARDTDYRVVFDGQSTRDYHVHVFDYPKVERVDAELSYPEYTGLSPKTIEDTYRVTAVEGTGVDWRIRLNKPVTEARLVPREGDPIALTPVEDEPGVYRLQQVLDKSARYVVALTDADGRENRDRPELVIETVANLRPELKLAFPRGEQSVSPLEEVAVEGETWDDFGLREVGLEFTLSGGEKQVVTLAANVPANQKQALAHQIALETLEARPDQFLSLALYADDVGPDSETRRTYGEMHFAEVRRFDEIFRQGQQQGGPGEQGQQPGGGGQRSAELLRLQRDIISATWNQIRRVDLADDDSKYVEDIDTIRQSQVQAATQAQEQAGETRDGASSELIAEAIQRMNEAAAALQEAVTKRDAELLREALTPEQAAYEVLLRLRAREHEVSQGQPGGGGGGGGGGGASQQQLQQLELDNEANRYETNTQAQQQQTEQAREENRILNRLKELARRQQDINERLQELQTALQAAQTEAAREEIERQLKRLREQQREMLRDVDETQQELDRVRRADEWQEQREQLAQTRDQVQQAADALDEGQVPSALSAGTRAERQLDSMREEMRQRSAGRFNDAMRDLRQSTRELDQRQQELTQQLSDRTSRGLRSLRDEEFGEGFRKGIADQKQQLDDVLNRIREITLEAENVEPLLSRNLYDTYRQASQDQISQKLDLTSQLVEQGFPREAEPFQRQASAGFDRLRQGVEEAAESVLGDEATALQLARDEVSDLARQIEEEIRRQSGQGNPDTSPNRVQSASGQRDAHGEPGRNVQPGAEQGQSGQGGENQGTEPSESGEGQQSRNGNQQVPQGEREGEQPGQGGQSPNGQGQSGQSQNGDSPSGEQSAQLGEEGQQGQGGQQGQDGWPGQSSPDGQGSSQDGAEQQDGQNPGAQRDGIRQGGGSRAGQGGRTGGNGGWLVELLGNLSGPGGPITGDDFRQWSDRMRDVEEMLDDPELRQEVARVRARAQEFRSEFRRHSTVPQWGVVREMVAEPLLELRDRIAEELARRNNTRENVPIDRDPVPAPFVRQVREYYEALGRGD